MLPTFLCPPTDFFSSCSSSQTDIEIVLPGRNNTDGGVAPQFKYREGRYVLEVMLRHVGLLLLELWNNTQWTSKSLGCPILSQAIGIEMLKTVFGIDIGQLEGLPPGLCFLLSGFHWETSKYSFLAIKSDVLPPSLGYIFVALFRDTCKYLLHMV